MNTRAKTKVARPFALAVLFLAMACLCVGCAQAGQKAESASAEPAQVMAINGPTGIGMANLADDSAYNVQFVSQPDQVVSAVSSGSVDIAAVPTNLASTLYNKTQGGVKIVAVDALGSLYLVDNGQPVANLADLKGKTVYATGEGANPQYVLEYLLEQAGLVPGQDVTVTYVADNAQLAAMVANGEAPIAMLPEPFVSVAQAKNAGVQVALSVGDLWKQATGTDLALGCVVARTDYIDEHPAAIGAFLSDLDASIAQANGDVAATAQLCADKGILPNAQAAQAAIPRCGLVCLTGDDMKAPVNGFLGVLAQSNPTSVGGAVPGDGLYYKG
ncbi:ABC transporter substrate-binding protein [Hugonella massiliensis]|uniref:ABC transporter substrate-binding protein n=1 Tax=Hugonella massiliensis TaxID=1720315 RepID=UPI00073F1F66|nr:MqnA/MqnD/SBP family protein [Hugonella massiliensis]